MLVYPITPTNKKSTEQTADEYDREKKTLNIHDNELESTFTDEKRLWPRV